MFVCESEKECVFVCVRDRECVREMDGMFVQRERARVCICVCVTERECVFVCV
mgnify:CR=1 FL=1